MSCTHSTTRTPSYAERLFVVVLFSRTWRDLAAAPFRAL